LEILWGSVIEHGFPVQAWLTFRQALSLGGNVRKGAKKRPSEAALTLTLSG
jgi:antirestriction protein ArdC